MLWHNSVARIIVRSNGKTISEGTGFLVGSGLVLTCLHVVADLRAVPAVHPGDVKPRTLGQIHVSFEDPQQDGPPPYTIIAELKLIRWDAASDWVLIDCGEAPPGRKRTPLPLVGKCDRGRWSSYGFPEYHSGNPYNLWGEVIDYGTKIDDVPTIQLNVDSAIPAGGCSGAPVVVMRAAPGARDGTEAIVVGIVRQQPPAAGGGVGIEALFATPVAYVLPKCPELPDYDAPLRRALRWLTLRIAEVLVCPVGSHQTAPPLDCTGGAVSAVPPRGPELARGMASAFAVRGRSDPLRCDPPQR